MIVNNDVYGIVHKGIPKHIPGQMVEFSQLNEQGSYNVPKAARKKLQAAAKRKGAKVLWGTKKKPLAVQLPDGRVMEPTRSTVGNVIGAGFRGAGKGALAGAALGAGGGLGVQRHIMGVMAGKPVGKMVKSTAMAPFTGDLFKVYKPPSTGTPAMTKTWAGVTGATVGAAIGTGVGFIAGAAREAVRLFRRTGKVPGPVIIREPHLIEKRLYKLTQAQRKMVIAVAGMTVAHAVNIGIPKLLTFIVNKSPTVTAHNDLVALNQSIAKKHAKLHKSYTATMRDLQSKSKRYDGSDPVLQKELEDLVVKSAKDEGLLKRLTSLVDIVNGRIKDLRKSGGVLTVMLRKQEKQREQMAATGKWI